MCSSAHVLHVHLKVNFITTISDRQFKLFSVVLLQFDKPGARDNYDYPDMAKEAGTHSNNYSGRCSVAQKMIWMCVWHVCKCFMTLCLHPVSGQKALADAGIQYSDIEQACVGYVYGKFQMKCVRSSQMKSFGWWKILFVIIRIKMIHLLLLSRGSFRGLHMWSEGHLSQPGPNRDPYHQRQQQLLHRLHSPLYGPAANPGRWV